MARPPRAARPTGGGYKRLLDDFSPTLAQLAFAQMLERGNYQRQIRKARAVYRARRDRLVAVLAEHFPN